MKILFKNEFEYNSSIVATNESLNYPVYQLAHPFLHLRFQSSSTTSLITVNFDDDKCFSCFFLAYHTATSMSVEFKNSLGTVLKTLNITTSANTQPEAEYFDILTTVRSVEITINGSTGVFLGGIGGGCCYTMPNYLSVYTRPLTDNSISSESLNGQSLVSKIKPFRGFSFTISGLTKTILDEIIDKFVTVGTGKPLYIDLEANEDPIYAKITTTLDSSQRKISNSIPLDIREAR